LQALNVKRLNLISCGNSIAAGFSMSSFTKPLLLRNENIEKIIRGKGIEFKRYHFSRSEDNNDEHIYSWLINDVPLDIINRLNRFDISNMNEIGVDDKKANEYYPLYDKATLKQILVHENSSSIIIYNGATGSFLDNITRGGKHFFTYGIKRDCISIEAFLRYIQEMNREQNKNIQIYLCGAPQILGLSNIFINSKLKKLSENYANVVYVESIPKKLIYRRDDGKIIPDLHYDESEYLSFNNQIIRAINENFVLKEVFIRIDKMLYLLNKEYQLGNITKEELTGKIQSLNLLYLCEEYSGLFNSNMYRQLLIKIKKYLLERYQHDFYYVEKRNIKKLK